MSVALWPSLRCSRPHPRRPRGSQSGREKRQDGSCQVRAKKPLGTDPHRTISKNSSGCRLLIGHKKCFVLLCPIGEQFLPSFRPAFSPDPTDCPWFCERGIFLAEAVYLVLRSSSCYRGGSRGKVRTPPTPEMTFGFLIHLVFCKKKTMWFIGVEVEEETSVPPPKKILDPPLC